jgi:hypothetical protein
MEAHSVDLDVLLEFAKLAFSVVSLICTDVGVKTKSCTAGCLAAQLWIVSKTLEHPDTGQLDRIRRRLPKLLKDLNGICMVVVFMPLTSVTTRTNLLPYSGQNQ